MTIGIFLRPACVTPSRIRLLLLDFIWQAKHVPEATTFELACTRGVHDGMHTIWAILSTAKADVSRLKMMPFV